MDNQITIPPIQSISKFSEMLGSKVDVLRLDLLHPIVSGNKWFKLKYYIEDAEEKGYKKIVTFGGAYSNHIVATAFASKSQGFETIGIIRGEEPKTISHTLQQARDYGMELYFTSREEYQNKKTLEEYYLNKGYYIIPEGGCGSLGVKGSTEILDSVFDIKTYTHIICACGTGTMIAGIIQSSFPYQKVIGINVLKGYTEIKNDIIDLLDDRFKSKMFEILNEYHFGGYAKSPEKLLNWMNNFWQKEKIPTDKVYTAKLFYAVEDLISNNYFNNDSKLLVIHCGGLQGNLSLPKGTLLF
ncbi:MAG: 1-aminocyclopropane-1-carboxylate deaminase/D-cysteine desulfhydrase [Chitinophagaceae bacterium]